MKKIEMKECKTCSMRGCDFLKSLIEKTCKQCGKKFRGSNLRENKLCHDCKQKLIEEETNKFVDEYYKR